MSHVNDKFIRLRPTQESVETINEKFDKVEADTIVKKCVHSIILLGMGRNVIDRMTLRSLVFPNMFYKYVAIFMEIANMQLNELFSMRLYEMDAKYLLVNSKPDAQDMIEPTNDKHEYLALLEFILLDIFGSTENRLNLDELMNSLSPLELEKSHVEEYIEKFMKRQYLDKVKDNGKIYYKWGPRAKAEIDPDGFFDLFLELNESRSPDDWPELKRRIEELKEIPDRYLN